MDGAIEDEDEGIEEIVTRVAAQAGAVGVGVLGEEVRGGGSRVSGSGSGTGRGPWGKVELDEDEEGEDRGPGGMKKWRCVYPAYLDKSKTVPEGRRVRKDLCCDAPTGLEIYDSVRHLGLPAVHEPNKAYPRDWLSPSRVKVQILGSDGVTPNVSDIPNKRVLLRRIAELVPRHAGRQAKAQAQSKSGGGGKKGKKGKR